MFLKDPISLGPPASVKTLNTFDKELTLYLPLFIAPITETCIVLISPTVKANFDSFEFKLG